MGAEYTVDEVSVLGDGKSYDRDEVELARVGKRQLLKRRFGLLSMTGFSCTLMATWEGVLVGLVFGLKNGGPAGLIYGFLLAWVGNLSVVMAMGELSSMFPTAGGQYHWASILAPWRMRKFVSYIIGWTTVIAWICATASQFYACASLLQAAVSVNETSYIGSSWQEFLITIGMTVLLVLVTTLVGSVLPTLEIVLLLLHVLGFLATMISLVYYAPTGDAAGKRAKEVFGTFQNGGGWNSQVLSFFVGIQGNALAFIGTDGPIHMCEEVAKSSVTVARSMLLSTVINGMLGFAILVSILFSVEDLHKLGNTPGSFPVIQMLQDRFDSAGGAIAIVSLIIVIDFTAGIAVMSSSSRIMWSFARDRGLPAWRWLRKVDSRTSIPMNTIMATSIAASLLALINIPSAAAFQDIVTYVVEGFYISYLLVLSLLLFRRIRGEIHEPQHASMLHHADQPFTWGPWRIKGWLGSLNNVVAVIYLTIVCFFCFWPQDAEVTPSTMNYSILLIGAVMLGSVVWYYINGKTHFSGPLVEVQIVDEIVVHDATKSG